MRLSAVLQMRKPFLQNGYMRAVSKVMRLLTLKPIKEVEFQFDPFTGNIRSARQAMIYLLGEKIQRTNPTIDIRTKAGEVSRNVKTLELHLSVKDAPI